MRKTILIIRKSISFAKPAFAAGLAGFALIIFPLCPRTLHAQWKMLPMHDPDYDQGTSIYFRPDNPQIGFICDEGYNYKTTDGGYTWDTITLAYNWESYTISAIVNGFTFENSDTGWSSGVPLYKTTDGGNTWKKVSTIGGGDDIYYDKKYNKLFVADPGGGGVYESSNEGITWTQHLAGSGTETFSFWNDDTGVVMTGSGGFYLTTDGGKTWNPPGANAGNPLYQILAIPGTTTAFAIDQYGVVRRTDDLWHTCYDVYHFPPEYIGFLGRVGPLPSNMCITGDLQNLYVTLDSGCFRSTDQGKTWKYLCGVWSPDRGGEGTIERFFAKGSRVFVSSADTDGTHFWYQNVDSMQYFPTGLAFPDSSKQTSVQPGTPVTVNYSLETSDAIGVGTGHLVFRYDSDALELKSLTLPASWRILDSSSGGGELSLTIAADSTQAIPNPMVSLTFNTYLSQTSGAITRIYLDSTYLSGHRLNCDCQALSTGAPDSVEIDFTGCGDSTILAAMEGQPPFSITSIVPNPASTSLTVTVSGGPLSGMDYQLFDALGNCVLTEPGVRRTPLQLDVSALPSGVYFLRLSSGGYALSRSVAIER